MNSAASRVNTTDYTFRLNVAKAAWRKKVVELVQQAKQIIANGERNANAVTDSTKRNGVGAEQLQRNYRDEARIKAADVRQHAQAYRNRADGVGELEVLYDADVRNDMAFRAEHQELINQARDLKLLVYGAKEQPLATFFDRRLAGLTLRRSASGFSVLESGGSAYHQ